VQEELIELSMGPLDLAAIHSLPPIEHMHEQFRITCWSSIDGIGEHLHLTPRERQKK
jgi:hypothetical protein